eukprot:352268_1
MVRFLITLSCFFICAYSLSSAPVFSPSNKQDEKTKYSTKIKRSEYFHHHYIYYESPNIKSNKKNIEHDHEIKVPTEKRILKLYHMIDTNKDDIISPNELQSILHIHKYPKYHHKHKELLETAIKRLDLNSDGIIEKEEYLFHMRQSTKAFSEDLLSGNIPNEDLSKFATLI